VIVLTI